MKLKVATPSIRLVIRRRPRPTYRFTEFCSYKGVRHLGSISYRIGIYCLVQTLALAPFVFNTHSPLAIGLYLCSMTLTLMWISLLYQFSKQHTGTCIAYALVAPPIITSSGPVVTLALSRHHREQ